jgi:hypothetical protein
MRAFCLGLAVAAMLPAGTAAGEAVQHLSRATVPFGYISQGFTSQVQPVFVTNTGDAPLTISALTLEGPQAGNFAIAASGTCAPPITL